jgi:hypothetical protein
MRKNLGVLGEIPHGESKHGRKPAPKTVSAKQGPRLFSFQLRIMAETADPGRLTLPSVAAGLTSATTTASFGKQPDHFSFSSW